MSTKGINRRGFLKTAGAAAAAAGTAQFFAPAILKAQQTPIKIGHLVPLTGFLSPMGDFASKAGKLAIDEINAAGGVLGRKLETIVDDETNPGVGVQKATKMIQQDKVDFLLGTVSSAVALAVMDVAERYQKIFFNTGSNSDEIRGAKCNYYTFCTEASNTQYVKAIGRYLVKNKNYKTFYILTSDYAFCHDPTRVTVSVEFTLYPHDDVSSPSEISTYYRINDGSQQIYNSNNKPRISTEQSNNKIEFWSVDAAKNEETPHNVVSGIKIDRTIPTIVIETPEWGLVPKGDVKVWYCL